MATTLVHTYIRVHPVNVTVVLLLLPPCGPPCGNSYSKIQYNINTYLSTSLAHVLPVMANHAASEGLDCTRHLYVSMYVCIRIYVVLDTLHNCLPGVANIVHRMGIYVHVCM